MATLTPYLPLATFLVMTEMAASDVQLVENKAPGFFEARAALEQARLDARLRKRYAVPFNQNGGPVPAVVVGWLVAIITPSIYRKRGVNAAQDDMVKKLEDLADTALAEIKEAADAVEGLFDLPLLDSGTASAISQGEPMGHGYASPYVATYERDARAAAEDRDFGFGDCDR